MNALLVNFTTELRKTLRSFPENVEPDKVWAISVHLQPSGERKRMRILIWTTI